MFTVMESQKHQWYDTLKQFPERLPHHEPEPCSLPRSKRQWTWVSFLLATMGLIAFTTIFSGHSVNCQHIVDTVASHSLTKNAVNAAASVLNVFQVYPPVFTPLSSDSAVMTNGVGSETSVQPASSSSSCLVQKTLMTHVFANSYGMPFVGTVVPPKCNFNRVVFNTTFTAAGRQFDRLGSAYFGDIEIWRFSTAEPTQSGIVFSYVKDMTHYLSLFKTQQKLIFDLGNTVNDVYTAPIHVTLTATYFSDDSTVVPADKIVPVSARMSAKNAPSSYQIPSQQALNSITLPRNIKKAVFSLAATGQIDEEFWFGNVFSSEVNTFAGTTLLGYSPFREVQLFIDGLLAGVAWPFPIIFTGGVVPGFWRPVVGIDVFDLREDEIDITPWLPTLCDGRSHTFQIRVAGINDNGKGNGVITETVGSYWVVTGKIFTWLDPAGSITTGSQFTRNLPAPSIDLSSTVGKGPKGANRTLTYDTAVSRQIDISSNVRTAAGSKKVEWRQSLTYKNHGSFTKFGNVQLTNQTTEGSDTSSNGYARQINYPVTVDTTYTMDSKSGNFSITAALTRGQTISILGQPTFPTGLQSFDDIRASNSYPRFQGTDLQTTQNGSAYYFSNGANTVTRGSGTTQQDLKFSGVRSDNTTSGSNRPNNSYELYRRHVLAANDSVRQDQESLMGAPFTTRQSAEAAPPGSMQDFAGRSLLRMLGRGPGGD